MTKQYLRGGAEGFVQASNELVRIMMKGNRGDGMTGTMARFPLSDFGV